MMDKAIEKLTKEMMSAGDPLVTMLEEHLTNICTNEAVANKILAEDKSLKKVRDELWEMARNKKQGSGAFIPDEECYQVAEKYFGITEEDKSATSNGRSTTEVIDILDFL